MAAKNYEQEHTHTHGTTTVTTIIGASLSEPHLDELAGAFLWCIYIFVSMGSPFGPAWTLVNTQRANVSRLSKGQRSHHVSQMGKKVSDFILCLSSKFAYSEAAMYGLYTDGESYHQTVA